MKSIAIVLALLGLSAIVWADSLWVGSWGPARDRTGDGPNHDGGGSR